MLTSDEAQSLMIVNCQLVSLKMSWKVCLAILALVLAYFYSEWSSEYETINRTVINSWTKSVILPHKRFLKILAGYVER